MRYFGRGVCSLSKVSLKKQQQLSLNSIHSILLIRGLLIPLCGLLNPLRSLTNPEQACAIYDNLRQFVDQPPQSFVSRLAELSASAACSS